MSKAENLKSYSSLSVSDVAELLPLKERQIRNLIKDKGLPARSDPRGFMLDWSSTLEWYVQYRIAQKVGNGGNPGPKVGSNHPDMPQEPINEALLRKTVAEADLKELQLARERGQVAAIADVERVLMAANKTIQTRVLALPASVAPQLIGLEDRARIDAILMRTCRDVLTNLATLDAVREVHGAHRLDDDE